jgi:hypothetical protein
MRARFVPSYYARDLINKLQQLKQGAKSVEAYYQELQIGMLRCNLEERVDAAMAPFVAGLKHEIQDILEYKDYANITRLFHFACKAEREVQGPHASAKTNFSVGRTNLWQRNNGCIAPSFASPNRVAPSTSNNSSKPQTATTNSATRAPSATKSTPPPIESAAPSSRARDIQCHRCKGFGHVMRDCSSNHVLVVKDDGECSSASDFDDDTLALLAADPTGNDDHPEEHISTGDADHYQRPIVQGMLSTQMERVEQNQRHTLFQTKCVIKELSCRMIIDGGSCNNLASSNMVDNLALTTKPHPHPYHIQWLNNIGKANVTKLVRINFAICSYHDVVECDVVPMQACHILLGRPWQSDKDFMHHGRLNQYSFLHHDKKIVLHPMSSEAIMHNNVAAARKTKSHDHAEITNHIATKDGVKYEKTHSNSVASKKSEIILKGGCLLTTKSEVSGLLASSSVSYALICKDALISLHNMQQSLPPIVANILQEYADFFHVKFQWSVTTPRH